jgi:hypothetical protein
MMYERAHLETLVTVLDVTPRALGRDACGDWMIGGKHGHILGDGTGDRLIDSFARDDTITLGNGAGDSYVAANDADGNKVCSLW